MKRRLAAPAGLLLALALAAPARAVEGITKAQADSILSELRQIHVLLEKGLQQGAGRAAAPTPAPERNVTLPPIVAHELGRPDAPLTLVEFTDYQCPYCRQFHISTFEQIKKKYIDTGKLRFISRDLPLDFHKLSLGAANAARCAGEQGRYWELRNVMIVNADRLEPSSLLTYARDLGMDTTRFGACLRSERYAPEIHKDLDDAQAAAVSATPTFVLGRTTSRGIQGVVIVGAMPYEAFEAKIQEMLGK